MKRLDVAHIIKTFDNIKFDDNSLFTSLLKQWKFSVVITVTSTAFSFLNEVCY